MHSSQVRLMLTALLGVFALSAVAAAAAQAEEAPFWSIGGTRLAEGKTHYTTTKIYNVTGSTKGFTLSAAGKTIHCESVRLKEGVLLGSNASNPGTSYGVMELFGECTVVGNGSTCKPVEPIVTHNLKSELVESEKGEKGSLLTEFKPEKGVQLTTISFTGACTINPVGVEGSVAGQILTDPNNGALGELVKLPNEKKEAHSWLLNFPATPVKEVWLIKEGAGKTEKIELKAFTELATLEGTQLILLAKKNSKGEFESEEVNWSPLP